MKMDRCPDPDTGQFLWCSKEALEATPELGRQLVEYIADQLGEGARRLLEG